MHESKGVFEGHTLHTRELQHASYSCMHGKHSSALVWQLEICDIAEAMNQLANCASG